VLHKLLAVWFTANKKTYYSLVLATNIACCLELWIGTKVWRHQGKFGSSNPILKIWQHQSNKG